MTRCGHAGRALHLRANRLSPEVMVDPRRPLDDSLRRLIASRSAVEAVSDDYARRLARVVKEWRTIPPNHLPPESQAPFRAILARVPRQPRIRCVPGSETFVALALLSDPELAALQAEMLRLIDGLEPPGEQGGPAPRA